MIVVPLIPCKQETDLDVEVRVLSGVDPDSYGDSWRGYISYLAGVGLSALILLCVCIVLSLMARKPQIEENDEGWVEFVPDRDEGYEQELEEDDDDVIEKPKSPLEELLLQENARVVTTLCDIVEVTEFDEVAGALVAIFEFHNQTLELIKKLITKEVHEAHSAGEYSPLIILLFCLLDLFSPQKVLCSEVTVLRAR